MHRPFRATQSLSSCGSLNYIGDCHHCGTSFPILVAIRDPYYPHDIVDNRCGSCHGPLAEPHTEPEIVRLVKLEEVANDQKQ